MTMPQHANLSDREAFYNAILDAWDDAAVRLVFADWLEEQDDPTGHLRATMIRLGVEERTYTDKKRRRRRGQRHANEVLRG